MLEEKEGEERKEEGGEEKGSGSVLPVGGGKLSDINIDSTNQYIRKISQIDH